jgi:uncharacterized membrane protein YtjA (UPF0391 family)
MLPTAGRFSKGLREAIQLRRGALAGWAGSAAAVGTRSVPESWISGFAARRRPRRLEELAVTLLKWALIFFVVSIIAGILGFTGISAASADVARFLFYVFVVIFLVLLILGLTIFRV